MLFSSRFGKGLVVTACAKANKKNKTLVLVRQGKALVADENKNNNPAIDPIT